MEFGLSDEQSAVRDLADTLFGDFGGDERAGAFDAAQSADGYDRALWGKLIHTGLATLTLPERAGGSGMGMLELTLVLEQQGRHLASAPLWQHQLAMLAIHAFGEPGVSARVLPGLRGGDCLATVDASVEGKPSLRAVLDGDAWVLDGSIGPLGAIGAGSVSTKWLVTPVQTAGGARLAIVDLDAGDIARVEGVSTDGEALATFAFANVRVPAGQIVGDAAALDWLRCRAIACVAALQLGVAQEALLRTAQYASERTQFGRPIGSFQAVALRAADGFIDVEVLRTVLWQLAWRLDAGLDAGGETSGAALMLKQLACDSGHRVAHTAQHLHGGLGADLTYPLHRFYLRSRALEMTLGGARASAAALGAWLAANPDAGVES
ncbi:acyl-CoA dehydrogenase family protein [Paraburkholderia oxyphila]|uniref:acyl-CoA dehydrogenase family protein n=1 Tax=Paraburkholderia oxyphila TaxID=614212 RepID=UPI00047FDA6E|nr:acyl-CoA dehydrogenase family protein [Paraburkholderia oxyphila]